MDTFTLRVFQREVATQCRFALMSVELLNLANAGMAQARTAGTQISTTQLWFSLQSFLIAAANISKLLWGTKAGTNAETWKRRTRERLQLRVSLGVAENSILKLSPEFRNHFEHLDERIEDWAEASPRRVLISDLIGPTSGFGGVAPDEFLRSYDPDTQRLSFRGETFEIVPVVQAIDALLTVVQQEAAKPHWDDPGQSAIAAGGGQ